MLRLPETRVFRQNWILPEWSARCSVNDHAKERAHEFRPTHKAETLGWLSLCRSNHATVLRIPACRL